MLSCPSPDVSLAATVVTTVEAVKIEACCLSFGAGSCEAVAGGETDVVISRESIKPTDADVVTACKVGERTELDAGAETIEGLAESVDGGGVFKGEMPDATTAGDDDKVAGGGGVNGGLDNGVAAPTDGESGGRLATEVVVKTEDMFIIFSM